MSERLLLYTQAPIYITDAGVAVEQQALNGLRLWAENFEHVTVMVPGRTGAPPQGWVDWTNLPNVDLVPMPDGFRPDRFARHVAPQSRRIADLIDKADYLCFAIGGLLGDWGALSALIAHHKGRGYAIWTDRVESDVTRKSAGTGPWRRRLQARLTYRPMAWLERHVIARADLGLFHGAETFAAYAPYARNPVLAHDIHLSSGLQIDAASLDRKCAEVAGRPLRLGYAGRVHWSKGWKDWVDVVDQLGKSGHAVEATWLGGGEDYEALKAEIAARGMKANVTLPGFVKERAIVLDTLRQFDLLLFCHKTKESPRILIEALTQATPIVGYGDAYSRDLIAEAGGGILVGRNDSKALAHAVGRLSDDRDTLAELMRRAATDARRFDDKSVFLHRSSEIKEHVRPN